MNLKKLIEVVEEVDRLAYGRFYDPGEGCGCLVGTVLLKEGFAINNLYEVDACLEVPYIEGDIGVDLEFDVSIIDDNSLEYRARQLLEAHYQVVNEQVDELIGINDAVSKASETCEQRRDRVLVGLRELEAADA